MRDYNAVHYGKTNLKIKDKKERIYNTTSFKNQYMTKRGFDPLDETNIKAYRRTARLGLIRKVFNPDNTLNWDETIRLTLEAVQAYRTDNRSDTEIIKNIESTSPPVSSIEERKVEVNIHVGQQVKRPLKYTKSNVKPKIVVRTTGNESFPLKIVGEENDPNDYQIRMFPQLNDGLSLEEFDSYRYENYIKQDNELQRVSYNIIDSTVKMNKTQEKKHEKKIEAHKKKWEIFGENWSDFVDANGYGDYNMILVGRDNEMDMSVHDTWEKVNSGTDYAQLLEANKDDIISV